MRMENDMSDRPELCKDMDSTIFRNYYYLKEERVAFCRENGLPVSGLKERNDAADFAAAEKKSPEA